MSLASRINAFTGHLETIIPSLFRRVKVHYERTRVELSDGDFIDLDRISNGNGKLLVLLHGLEGSSQSKYIKGFAKYFSQRSFDICVINFRGCSGEPNRLLRSYHSGVTADLHEVLVYLLHEASIQKIYLCGFSLGGNVLLKYLGDNVYPVDPKVKAAAAFSVPIDLAGGSKKLAGKGNRIYMQTFLRTMNRKIKHKSTVFDGQLELGNINKIQTFGEWDSRYTAPIHGFKDSGDYYAKCSSKPFLKTIGVPTLLVNAKNDPFLPAECYPGKEELGNKVVFESPERGGHVGFRKGLFYGEFYSEERAFRFFKENE